MATNFYDKASLVMIPDAPLDGKVLSVKPEDRSGDFTFLRGSNLAATRVGADGLIEKGRENVLLQSNNFDTTWLLASTSVTGGQSGYDGSNDAWLLEATETGSYRRVYQSGINLGVNTFSIYAKANTSNFLFLLNNKSATDAIAWFDLSDGSIGGVNGAIDTSIESVGNGWYRCSVTSVFADNQYFVSVADGIGNVTGTIGASLYIQDAQLEIGALATDYIESGATTGKAGLLENEPRFDYSGGATCPSLLLEPQATALNQFSEQLDDVYWNKANCTITANQTASPSGYVDADLVIDDTSNNQHVITRTIAVTSGNKYTASFFLKAAGYTTAAIRMGAGSLWNGGTGPTVEFDLVALTGTVKDGSGITFDIEDYGNGWRRCSVTGTCVTSGNTVFSLYVKQYAGYIGNGTDGLYVWGANITATSYLQSYIPTYDTIVTRGVDLCNGAGDVNTFNSAEGVLYFEVAGFENDLSSRYISISDGTSNNAIRVFYYQDSGTTFFRKNVNSVQTTIFSTNDINKSELTKIAIKYNSTNFDIFSNGVKLSTNLDSNSFNINTLSEVNFANGDGVNNSFNGKVNQLLTFNTALSDDECIALTTL